MTSKQQACAAAVNVELYEGLLMLQVMVQPPNAKQHHTPLSWRFASPF
jgi:hypothetical protein